MSEIIEFEDGKLVSSGYVEIDGKRHEVHEAVYEGNTPASAYNINRMQTNLLDKIKEIQQDIHIEKTKNTEIYSNILTKSYTTSQDGIMAIKLGSALKASCGSMLTLKGHIFNYQRSTDFELNVYLYKNNGYLYPTICYSNKDANISSKIATGNNGNIYLLLGEQSTRWSFPTVSIEQVIVSWADTGKEIWKEGWTVDFITSTENFSEITNCKNVSQMIITTGQEFETGRIIDGKEEYGKKINFGNFPNTDWKRVSHGVTNINLISGTMRVTTADGSNYVLSLGPGISMSTGKNMYMAVDSTNIVLQTFADESRNTGIAEIYYTKN